MFRKSGARDEPRDPIHMLLGDAMEKVHRNPDLQKVQPISSVQTDSTHVRRSIRKECQSGPVGMSGKIMTLAKKTLFLIRSCPVGMEDVAVVTMREPRDCSFWSRICEIGNELFRTQMLCVCITSLRSYLPRIRKDDPGYPRLFALDDQHVVSSVQACDWWTVTHVASWS